MTERESLMDTDVPTENDERNTGLIIALIEIEKLREESAVKAHGHIAMGDDDLAYWEVYATLSKVAKAKAAIDWVLESPRRGVYL